eukprot:COSAG01_NODE_5474_length_4237_cov_1.975592_1_plen_93_part_00
MIPLMAQRGYRANGWLGLLLGTALWYPIYGLEDADAATFEAKVDPIVGAIRDRAQVKHSIGRHTTSLTQQLAAKDAELEALRAALALASKDA